MKMEDERVQDNELLQIAMLGHKRIPSREGGIEIVVEELANRMVKRGHEVVCYNRKGHHVSGKEYDSYFKGKEYKGIKVKNVFTINGRGLAAMSSSLSAALCAAFGKYDVVHFHAEGPCAMLWIPKLFGKKCIATVHGLDWQRAKWRQGFGAKYIRFGEKVLVRYADEIIVLSEGVRRYFKETYNRNVTFIPNGINPAQIRQAKVIKEKFKLEKDSYICYLGRLTEEKGVHYLIEAYKKNTLNKKLVIAGASSDTDDYVQYLKKIAQGCENIIFTGFVQGEILDEIYSNAYLYVLPSDLEGMPLSLLEAMSYKNCCVVSSIEEMTEVVEDKAIVFKKGSIEDLAKKLQMLCENPEIVMKYKEEAADFICKKYSWDDVVNQTLRLYKQ